MKKKLAVFFLFNVLISFSYAMQEDNNQKKKPLLTRSQAKSHARRRSLSRHDHDRQKIDKQTFSMPHEFIQQHYKKQKDDQYNLLHSLTYVLGEKTGAKAQYRAVKGIETTFTNADVDASVEKKIKEKAANFYIKYYSLLSQSHVIACERYFKSAQDTHNETRKLTSLFKAKKKAEDAMTYLILLTTLNGQQVHDTLEHQNINLMLQAIEDNLSRIPSYEDKVKIKNAALEKEKMAQEILAAAQVASTKNKKADKKKDETFKAATLVAMQQKKEKLDQLNHQTKHHDTKKRSSLASLLGRKSTDISPKNDALIQQAHDLLLESAELNLKGYHVSPSRRDLEKVKVVLESAQGFTIDLAQRERAEKLRKAVEEEEKNRNSDSEDDSL